MNKTDPKILDLWIADNIYRAEQASGKDGLMPPEQAVQKLTEHLHPWNRIDGR